MLLFLLSRFRPDSALLKTWSTWNKLDTSCAWSRQITFNVAGNQSYDEVCALAIGDSCESSCHIYGGIGWPGNFLIIESKGVKRVSKGFEIFIYSFICIYNVCVIYIWKIKFPTSFKEKQILADCRLPESTSFDKNCCTEGDDFESQMRSNVGDQSSWFRGTIQNNVLRRNAIIPCVIFGCTISKKQINTGYAG